MKPVIGRLLCRLGRHDWQLLFVQSGGGGQNHFVKRWVVSTYQCWRCPARRTHVKEAMDRFDAGVYPTDEDAAPSGPLDPPGTREEILRQLREHPPGFTSLELQARLALSEAVVDGHLCALRSVDAVEHLPDDDRWVWSRPSGEAG